MIKLKKSAFVVDDDPLYADSISVQLEKSGYEVKCFDSGHRAFEELCATLDLIVLDYDLGEQQTGLQYLKKFKNTTPNVPVLFLSQKNNVAAASQALWSGASFYIEKNDECVEKIPGVLDYMNIGANNKFQSALISLRKKVFRLYNF